MQQFIATIAAYLITHNLVPTQPEANRHATAIADAIVAAPVGGEDAAIRTYMGNQLAQTLPNATQHATAIWAAATPADRQAIVDARVAANQNNGGGNNGGGNNTQTHTPPAPAPAARNGNGWAMAAAFVALIAAILAGLGLMRDNGKSDLAGIKAAVIDPASGTSVLDQLNAHHAWVQGNVAQKSDLGALAKTADLSSLAKEASVQALGGKIDAVDTKVTHVEKIVVGALTYTPKATKCANGTVCQPEEKILSIKDMARRSDLAGLVHKGDLAGLANRGELEKAFANQGTVVVETEGDARVLTGDDALRAPPPPAPAFATP